MLSEFLLKLVILFNSNRTKFFFFFFSPLQARPGLSEFPAPMLHFDSNLASLVRPVHHQLLLVTSTYARAHLDVDGFILVTRLPCNLRHLSASYP